MNRDLPRQTKHHWRRRAHRLEVPLPAFWGLAEDDCKEVGIAQGPSRGGCFVEALVDELRAETIYLRVLLPTGRWLPLRAEPVYYVKGRGIGASFTGIGDEDGLVRIFELSADEGRVALRRPRPRGQEAPRVEVVMLLDEERAETADARQVGRRHTSDAWPGLGVR